MIGVNIFMDTKYSDNWVKALNNFEAANASYAIATVVRAESPSSAKAGDKAIISPEGEIYGWIGGGCAQPVVIKAVADVLKDGNPLVLRISPSTGKTITKNGVRDVHMACHSGGSIELLIEPRLPRQTLLIIGSAPIAKKLEVVAPLLSIPVKRIHPGQSVDGFFQCAVVATQGRKDKAGLIQALRQSEGFIHFVASSKKAIKFREELADEGFTSSELERICAPAGIEIHAETVDEIVVSILAGFIKGYREFNHNPLKSTEKVA